MIYKNTFIYYSSLPTFLNNCRMIYDKICDTGTIIQKQIISETTSMTKLKWSKINTQKHHNN